jgi:hypothetical protein
MRKRALWVFVQLAVVGVHGAFSGIPPDSVARALLRVGFSDNHAFSLLQELTQQASTRLSGSPGSLRAMGAPTFLRSSTAGLRDSGCLLTHTGISTITILPTIPLTRCTRVSLSTVQS